MQNELESKVLKMTKTEVKPKPPLTCFCLQKVKSRKERMQKIHRVEKEEPRSHGQTLKENVTEEELEENPTSYSCFMTYGMDINHILNIDSGATSHMCSNKNLFKTINFKHKADVFMADGQKIPTTGIGDIFCPSAIKTSALCLK